MATHPGIAVAVKILESPYTISRPVSTAYKEVQASLDTQFFDAVTGAESVHQALATLQQQADQYMSGQSAL
jgi:ABC-type glycerol-3-phosphate transport system substrate-binding protein